MEERLLRGLIFLMSEIEDGNLLHRGGLSAWQTVKEESKKNSPSHLLKRRIAW